MKKSAASVLLFGIFSILLQGFPDPAYASDKSESEVVVIGNSRLPFDSLSSSELKDIFQRKKTTWEDGRKISFALLDSGKTHQQFVRYYLQKTPAQYHRYWKKLVFSGRGVPPMTFRDEKSLMAHVALTSGTIGYVSQATRLSGVKKIHIIEESTDAPEKAAAETPAPIQNQVLPAIPETTQENKSRTIFNRIFY
ncbi:MAG: hypothetical protein ABIK15_04555 [Pseudomonadota bacterium]